MEITNFTLFTLLITMGFGVSSVPSNETEALRGMDLDDPETLGKILAVAVNLLADGQGECTKMGMLRGWFGLKWANG